MVVFSVKVCTMGIVEELVAGDKNKDDIINLMKQVQLSVSTAARRLEKLNEESDSCAAAVCTKLVLLGKVRSPFKSKVRHPKIP